MKTSIMVILALIASPALGADFTKAGNAVFVNGDIQRGDNVKLIKLVDPSVEYIVLDSDGGSFFETVELAKTVMANGLSTVSSGKCNVECAWLWLAGKTKLVDASNPANPVISQPRADGADSTDLPTMALAGWLVGQYDLPFQTSYFFGFLGQGKQKEVTLTNEFMSTKWEITVDVWSFQD